MKKLSLLLLTLIVCCFTACHKDIWAELENLDQRVTKLEELCKEMNTNITSLQTIVSVLQSNDFITGIVEIKKNGEVIGYTITFGKHDPITIYHGQDGKDGADGKDGQDGQDGQNGSANAPVIGVAQDTDGVYYWTLNGEWLLDDNGNKLPVSGKDGQNGTNGTNGQDGADGKDGQDGENGKDGADGQDGKDGKDGITPQLKIEDGYWYISYDNGATWTELGKATGEDGKDGQNGADGKDGQDGTDGKDGQDGDSMFQSVTQDENYVYFTLADGTVIKIAKGSSLSENRIEGQLSGVFSVSRYDKVNFSQGNLLYNPALDTWRFAEQQYKLYKKNPINMTQSSNLWMDLLPWGSTWYHNVSPLGTTSSGYPYTGYKFNDSERAINFSYFDWGVYCRIENGGNKKNMWRTLSSDEWLYLFSKRKNASNLYVKGYVDNKSGYILLPDTSTITIKDPNILVAGLKYSSEIWSEKFEKLGCVFLPDNNYWTIDSSSEDIEAGFILHGYYVDFSTLEVEFARNNYGNSYEYHYIRLVRDFN